MTLISLVTLLIVELLLRWLAPIHLTGIPTALRFDEEVGYQAREGIHAFKLTDHLQEIRINQLGTVNFQESFGPYSRFVFAAGDSFTAGTGLPADAAYPFQLDLELNLDSDGYYQARYAVVNLGLAAFGGEQSLLMLKRYAARLGPPTFVLYLGANNDHDDDRLFLGGYSHRHIVPGSPYWGWMTRPLLVAGHSEVFKRAKIVASRLRRKRVLGDVGGRDSSGPSVAERCWPVIQRIRSECDELGATLILSWADGGSRSYTWLAETAAAEGVPFADWWSSVESVRRVVEEAPVDNPHSAGHHRAWVNRVIADTFADEIRKLEKQAPAPPANREPNVSP
jgi:hypothetical protein